MESRPPDPPIAKTLTCCTSTGGCSNRAPRKRCGRDTRHGSDEEAWNHVYEIVTYHVGEDILSAAEKTTKVRVGLTGPKKIAWTCIGVRQLVEKGVLFEIQVRAAAPPQ